MPRNRRTGEGDGGANLPAVPSAGTGEDVLEGEIVDDDAPRPDPVRVTAVVVRVIRHEHVQRTGRHVAYIPLGATVVARRLWDSRTTARFERLIHAAEAQGDHDAAFRWEELRQKFINDRHKRRMERRESALHVFRTLPWIIGGTTGSLFLIGGFLGIAEKRWSAVPEPFEVVAHIVMWVVIAVSVSYGPLLLAAPWIALAALWHAGRQHARTLPAGWLAPPREDSEDAGLVVTADSIVLALQHLPISELKRAFKDGWRPVFHTQPVRDGAGYSTVFSIPMGVTAQMIADQRPVLARNLHRAEIEVWPTDAERAGQGPPGTVAAWIANRGALDKGAPEYPLLHEGRADVFTGVPGGVTPRGDEVLIPVVGNNGAAGGMMGQGKSNACRVIMLGCALDPLCELDVFVFAQNGDFDAFQPRLAIYRKGTEDDTVLAAVGRLQELAGEVSRREGRLAELGAKKVTRGLAEAHPDMRPVVTLFSECHELFGHKEDGKLSELAKLAAELAIQTIKRARKTGIVLWFDTQSSRKEAIPPALVELVSVNVCFAVKTWRSNDGFLGDGSFQAGIRATELRPGRDRGRAVVTGVSDQQFDLLMWHYIEVNDDTGYDAAADVIARAAAAVAPGTPVEATGAAPAIEARDLLADLDQVLGQERVRLADVPALLRKLAPAWPPYRDLTGVQFRALLDDEGVPTTNTGNVPRLDPADLRRVLRQRESE